MKKLFFILLATLALTACEKKTTSNAESSEQPEVIESFHDFKRNYESENDIVIDDNFAISNYAFKKQQRSYKRVINLDKKIQIIINGNRNQVEQGEDERGKYYKVYYKEEE